MTCSSCHKAVCFPQFNSPTSSSGQCTNRGFFSLISFGGDGGSICLWDESAARYDLRSNNEEKLMNRTAEHRDYLGWNLLNWDSSHFAVISGSFVRTEREGSSRYISAVPWCAGAASGSAIRTGFSHQDGDPRGSGCVCRHLSAPPRMRIGASEHAGTAAAPLPGSRGEEGSSRGWQLGNSPPASALLGMNPSGSGAVPRLEEWHTYLTVSCQPPPPRLSKNFNLF